jgi:hypothetical protein
MAINSVTAMLKSTTEYEATDEERKLFEVGIKALSVIEDKIEKAKESMLANKYWIPE